jgi:DNA-binding transcriptional regulator PaaX
MKTSPAPQEWPAVTLRAYGLAYWLRGRVAGAPGGAAELQVTLGQLAREVGLSRGAVRSLVAELERAGALKVKKLAGLGLALRLQDGPELHAVVDRGGGDQERP